MCKHTSPWSILSKNIETKRLTSLIFIPPHSKQEAARLRGRIKISKTETNPKYYGPFLDSPPNKGTSHVTVIDRKGGIVSVTR